MHITPLHREEINARIKRARVLYKKGFSTREVGKVVGRTHAWVATHVKDLSSCV